MNNKENSKQSLAPKSKDNKTTMRKPLPVVTPRGDDTNKNNDRSNSQSRKSVMIKNTIVEQFQKDKRKTVSPNILPISSGINSNKNFKTTNNINIKSKKSESILKEERTPEKEIPLVSLPVLKEIKDAENSASSKSKRKYEEVISEIAGEIQLNSPIKIQDQVEKFYSDYDSVSGSSTWKENFINIISSEISCDSVTYLPISLTLNGSNLLSSQKFWILWIEYYRLSTPLSIQNLVNLFNESFNYISNESLIKSYYLKIMREQDPSLLKEHLVSKGKLLNIESSSNLTLTNQILFGLLESYAQFLLRSQCKSQSGDKRFKNSNSKTKDDDRNNIYQYTLNCEMTINPIFLKREFTNTEIYTSENIFICQMKQTSAEKETSPHFPYKTPLNQNSKRESMNQMNQVKEQSNSKIKNSHLSNDGSLNNMSNLKFEENDDVVDSLLSHGGNKHLMTQNMVVSQNTIDKQLDFNNKLQNANFMSLEELVCTGEIMQMQDNSDLTTSKGEETVLSVLPIENTEEAADNSSFSNSNKKHENFDISGQEKQIYKTEQIPDLGEEKLDVIQELEAEKILDEKDDKPEILIELNFQDHTPQISDNHHNRMNFTQSSQKSRTHSRSLSRGRRLNSYVTEEYPTNIVEGSIRTFNKNFNGEESAKSDRKKSSQKGEN